jgi:hypothetical protein
MHAKSSIFFISVTFFFIDENYAGSRKTGGDLLRRRLRGIARRALQLQLQIGSVTKLRDRRISRMRDPGCHQPRPDQQRFQSELQRLS